MVTFVVNQLSKKMMEMMRTGQQASCHVWSGSVISTHGSLVPGSFALDCSAAVACFAVAANQL
eukprot:1194862-Rhodomonas_salina.1